jgi:hypothetical protein
MYETPLPKGWKKFIDIPDGSHFEDSSGRRFIKLLSKTACGVPQKSGRIVLASKYGPESLFLPFNAVDYNGTSGTCSDWVPFKVLRKPK